MANYLNGYKGKTILITGGAGCIGSNLTKALIKAEQLRDHDVSATLESCA